MGVFGKEYLFFLCLQVLRRTKGIGKEEKKLCDTLERGRYIIYKVKV